MEEPAVGLFDQLGWVSKSCFYEDFGQSGTLSRETPSKVVLVSRLRPALERLNATLPSPAIDLAIEELTKDRSSLSPINANREIYQLLKNGVPVKVKDEHGAETPERVRVIDWDNPENNDFFLASQFWVSGEMYKRRADLVGFVNGLPLVFIELKAVHKRLENAYYGNLRDYKDTIPQIFWYNAFIILSNGSESRIGAITSEYEHFAEWKKINSEGEQGIVSLETIIRGTCEPRRLLDIIENFILYSDERGGTVKMVAKYHQYFGVNNAFNALVSLTPSYGHPSPIGRGAAGEGVNYRGGAAYSSLVERARELRKSQTTAEEILWELLRDRRFLGLKFRRQHQIGQFIADFYCDERKLVIEVDGSVHEQEEVKEQDRVKEEYLRSLSMTVVRILNEEIVKNPSRAFEKIHSALPSPFGRGLPVSLAGTEGEARAPSPVGRGIQSEGSTHRRLGVFWHTQGSGKSYSMVFFSQKVLRKLPGNFTFLVVTDRAELDDQIYKNFAKVDAVAEKENRVRAQSGEHLKDLLREDHRYLFTLIHKFHGRNLSADYLPLPVGEGPRARVQETPYPVLSTRDDIVVMTDEAHRTQYDVLALNMRNALPNASFIGFTGTPLIAEEEKTREVFGDYVSIYDFKQSADDKATVPLYYENRIPELQLTNEDLNEDIEQVVEDAMLDEDQEKKLEREFSREYHLITRDDRLEKIAEDIVAHFMGRGQAGKAMVVSVDKATAVRMYETVQKHWKLYLERLKLALTKARDHTEREELQERIRYMDETDIAVVVSQSQNEVDEFRKKGLDIAAHRQRMVKEDLDTKFKDPNDPFRIVFVCAMWMTGFDVPSCSTIYLDKPMRNHTLMQTIARANRVFRDKVNGLIVDYIGVFRNLQMALAIYGSGGGTGDGEMPVKDKQELLKVLGISIEQAEEFCREKNVSLDSIIAAASLEKIKLIDDAVEAIIVNDESKRKYISLANQVNSLYKAILPDPLANNFLPKRNVITVVAEKIKSLTPPADISRVMQAVETVLDGSISAQGYVIHDQETYGTKFIDLSQIDFGALRQRFQKSRKRMEAERLKGLIGVKLIKLVSLNKSRTDYLERFQKMIDEYNAGSVNVETFFQQLVDFAKELNEEEKRSISESLTEEELALFDILTKPEMTLSEKDKLEVKKVARELLEALKKEKLVLDWRKRQQSRAAVRLSVEEMLDRLPDVYTKEIYRHKCQAVYEHVYDAYYGSGKSLYSQVA